MPEPRSYPAGVTSWIDVGEPDLDAATAFYGGLFGWTFEEATASGSPRYLVASLDGQDVAGLSGPDGTDDPAWHTYVAVDDVDDVAQRVRAEGGRVTREPTTAGASGRYASCADPAGTPFRLWQAEARPGAQRVNVPGAWNFSDLHAADPGAAIAFYRAVFGWDVDDLGFATMIRRPGYGDHLAATVDPDIHQRQAGAPPGFADAIGWLVAAQPGERPHWHVSFTVADRDAIAEDADRLGGTVLEHRDTDWTREALVRDPRGAVFTASQYTPPA
jgi:hypothetical protein